ncbi:hypothetical protein CLOP_g24506 [Closterium sp. NIES-67]|nr:hypothetical protein CLOP_g24506 [Closterium sp. NIES-67]
MKWVVVRVPVVQTRGPGLMPRRINRSSNNNNNNNNNKNNNNKNKNKNNNNNNSNNNNNNSNNYNNNNSCSSSSSSRGDPRHGGLAALVAAHAARRPVLAPAL